MEMNRQQIQDRIQRDAHLFREIEKKLLEQEQIELNCAELARSKNELFFAEEYLKMAFLFRMGASVLASMASSCEDEYRKKTMGDELQTELTFMNELEQTEQDTEQAERMASAAEESGITSRNAAETI